MCSSCDSLFPVKQGKVLNIAFAGKQKITPSGLKVGAWTTNIYRNPRFLDRDKGPDDEFCVPDEVILCDDITQGIYCHLLCALSRAPEIVRVFSIFAGKGYHLQHRDIYFPASCKIIFRVILKD